MQPTSSGPQPYSPAERRARADAIADRLRAHFGTDLVALGIYGSISRGTDGPYSDIEMHCVVRGEGIDTAFEWSEGPWKAEVDVYNEETFLARAAELDEFWPVTHGAYAQVLPLFDPQGIFPRGREAVFAHSGAEFDAMIREVLVGDLYEVVGKVRNAVISSRPASLAAELVDAARYAACLVGLAQRRLFTSSAVMFDEALSLPDLPAGLEAFLRLVASGDLRDNQHAMQAVNALWAGMEAWAKNRGLLLYCGLDEVLAEHD